MIPRLPSLIFVVVLTSCGYSERITTDEGEPVKIDPAKAPNGIQMMQILLVNQSLPVKGTGCEGSWTANDKRRLQHRLATSLGYALDRKYPHAVLLGGCETERFELQSGKTIDGWRCSLNVMENNKKGEHVTSSTIAFGITRDTWDLIPETLSCM